MRTVDERSSEAVVTRERFKNKSEKLGDQVSLLAGSGIPLLIRTRLVVRIDDVFI